MLTRFTIAVPIKDKCQSKTNQPLQYVMHTVHTFTAHSVAVHEY